MSEEIDLQHWIPVNADPYDKSTHFRLTGGKAIFEPAHGGLIQSLHLPAFFKKFRPLTVEEQATHRYRPFVTGFDDGPVVWAWTDGRLWNGWQCPLIGVAAMDEFIKATIKEVGCETFTILPDGRLRFDPDPGASAEASVVDPDAYLYANQKHMVLPGYPGGVLVYDVGDMGLVWNWVVPEDERYASALGKHPAKLSMAVAEREKDSLPQGVKQLVAIVHSGPNKNGDFLDGVALGKALENFNQNPSNAGVTLVAHTERDPMNDIPSIRAVVPAPPGTVIGAADYKTGGHPLLLPRFIAVIHLQTPEQGLVEVGKALSNGADGIFLIDHHTSSVRLMIAYNLVRQHHPDAWIGANFLGLGPRDAVRRRAPDMNAIWMDELVEGLDFTQWAGELGAGKTWHLFMGAAFKYQIAGNTPEAEAALVASRGHVVCTSGPGTGEAPDLTKIVAMRGAIGNHPLALASGVTAENVAAFLPHVDCFVVATGISSDFHTLDPAKVRELADLIHSYHAIQDPKVS